MMLTTKGRYAVNAILELANPENDQQPVKLSNLAIKQKIPANYLEQIFAKLKRAELIKAIKGPGGGYILNMDPQDIRIANIIDAVNENIEMSGCVLKKVKSCNLSNINKCKTHNLWQGLTHQIRQYFHNITLHDVMIDNINI